jgi:hypothetical protein
VAGISDDDEISGSSKAGRGSGRERRQQGGSRHSSRDEGSTSSSYYKRRSVPATNSKCLQSQMRISICAFKRVFLVFFYWEKKVQGRLPFL